MVRYLSRSPMRSGIGRDTASGEAAYPRSSIPEAIVDLLRRQVALSMEDLYRGSSASDCTRRSPEGESLFGVRLRNSSHC